MHCNTLQHTVTHYNTLQRACASDFISVQTVSFWRASECSDDEIRGNFVYTCHKRSNLFEGKSAIRINILV